METVKLTKSGRHRPESTGVLKTARSRLLGSLTLRGSKGGAHRLVPKPSPSTETGQSPKGKEKFSEQAVTTRLQNETMNLANREPLMDAEAVKKWVGVNMGSLLAVIHPSGDAPRVFCFDKSREENGTRKASYVFVTDKQLRDIVSYRNTGYPTRETIERGTLIMEADLPKSNRRQVIGQRHPMPGAQVRGQTHDENGVLKNQAIAGETVLSVSPYDYAALSVRDIGSQQGTFIEHSAEFIKPQDPWEKKPHPPAYVKE